MLEEGGYLCGDPESAAAVISDTAFTGMPSGSHFQNLQRDAVPVAFERSILARSFCAPHL
jgi:hypothetical protein